MPRTIELTEASLLVLASLMAGPKHGYSIIRDVETQAGKPLGPGTLYGIIARLERAQLIRALEVEDRGRRPYRITASGKRVFQERLRTLTQYQKTLKLLATP